MTIVLDDDHLYAAVQAEATWQQRPLDDLVTEALRHWLESQEDAALHPVLDAARAEWTRRGGIEAGEFFRQLNETPHGSGAPPG